MFKCYLGLSIVTSQSWNPNQSTLNPKKIASRSIRHRKNPSHRAPLHLKNPFVFASTARSVSHPKARSAAHAVIAVKHASVISMMMNGLLNTNNNLFIFLFDDK